MSFAGERSSEVPAAQQPVGEGSPGIASASRDEPSETVDAAHERERLIAEVRRLEVELGRYRAHAERTSKLFLSATNYAEWVRERARHDAELALRKARARVEKLNTMARDLERTERELVRGQDELARLQTLTEETRARLSAFLTAGLEALSSEGPTAPEDTLMSASANLDDTLHRQVASASASEAVPVGEDETPEH